MYVAVIAARRLGLAAALAAALGACNFLPDHRPDDGGPLADAGDAGPADAASAAVDAVGPDAAPPDASVVDAGEPDAEF